MSRLFVLMFVCGVATLVVAGAILPAAAQDLEFTEEYLQDRANIGRGHELFRQQCSMCHGRNAYPGKAPRLNPARMTPDEIYLKTTYGFGRMPAWEHIFSDEERMAITAYMKSNIFSN